MVITLLHYTPLEVCSHAIRTCWNSFDKSDNGGEKDKALIDRVGNKFKHSSTLEHLSVVIKIDDNKELLKIFRENQFSTVTNNIVSYNLRTLIEVDLPIEIKKKIAPLDYHYLLY